MNNLLVSLMVVAVMPSHHECHHKLAHAWERAKFLVTAPIMLPVNGLVRTRAMWNGLKVHNMLDDSETERRAESFGQVLKDVLDEIQKEDPPAEYQREPEGPVPLVMNSVEI